MNKTVKNILLGLFSALLIASSIYLIYQLMSLDVLPPKFLFFLVAILLLIDTILVLVLFFYSKNTVSKITGWVLSIVIAVGSTFGGFYLYKTNAMFSNITDTSGKSKNLVSVIVKITSDIKDLRDIDNKKLGIFRTIGTSGTKACIEDIESKNINIEQVNYDGVTNLLDALYASEVDAIILNESSRSTVLELEGYKGFNQDTKVIYQTSFEVDSTNEAKAVDNIVSHPFNILITGSDSRNDLNENARSDVNMIATVNPETYTILLTSIPRDYYVTTVCDVTDGCQNGKLDKITHTGMTGINTTKRTIEDLFGIEINYTFKVGFESVERVVDTVGGIEVYVEPGYAVDKIGIKEGTNYLNGEQALRYARERYAYLEGDRQRTKNQQQVLMGVVNKLTSPSIISNYAQLMDVLGDTFITNMSSNELSSLIKYQLEKAPKWKFEQYMVDGQGNTLVCAELGQPAYVMVPDYSTVNLAKEKIKAVMDGQSRDLTTSKEIEE